MAVPATIKWEVMIGGSDTANGGGFDPGQTAGMLTDGAVAAANTAVPVFSSNSYSFVNGDIGAWVFISGNGWYKITGVANGLASLSANIGAGFQLSLTPTTIVGVSSSASLSSQTWSIDYSRQTGSQFTYTDLTCAGAGLTASSVLKPIGQQQVGNVIVLTGGTNITAGRYTLASVSGVTGTFVGAANMSTGASSNGAGAMGGALVSPGQASAVMVAGNDCCVAYSATAYTFASASTNIATGCVSSVGGASATNITRWIGYQTVPGDRGSKPLFQAGNITTFTMFTLSAADVYMENIAFDGVSKTSSRGISGNVGAIVYNCKFSNFTNNAVAAGSALSALKCEATGCSSVTAFGSANYFGCVAHDNTISGFNPTNTTTMVNCVSCNNSGASSDGFQFSNSTGTANCKNCLAYHNGRDGFRCSTNTTVTTLIDCLAYNNGTADFDGGGGVAHGLFLFNCAGGTQNNLVTANIVGFVTLTADPFVDSANGNFALKETSSSVLGVGLTGVLPGISTTGYTDLGPAQSNRRTQGTVNMAPGLASRYDSQGKLV